MDLKALREQAINKANDDFAEKKIESYKYNVKSMIHKISKNNQQIECLVKDNDSLKKQLSEYELEEFNRVNI